MRDNLLKQNRAITWISLLTTEYGHFLSYKIDTKQTSKFRQHVSVLRRDALPLKSRVSIDPQ